MTYWPTWLTGVLLIVGLPLVAVLVQAGIHRWWPRLAEGEHNDVAGFIIVVVGVIYAVLLAFVVIVTWENFSSAERVAGQEASALRSVYRGSVAFPDAARHQVRDGVRRYAAAAVDQEWPAMARGEAGDASVAQALDNLSQVLSRLPAETATQQEYVGVEAERFNDLVAARSNRLDFVDEGVPGVLWTALVVGGVVTIGFATIFGLRSRRLHVVITASLAAVIGVLLFVCVAINHPYAGDLAVPPHSLERVQADFPATP